MSISKRIITGNAILKVDLIGLELTIHRFYPAIACIKEILNSGELGPIKHMYGSLAPPKGIVGLDDICWQYTLGGGALMDMGCKSARLDQ